MSKAVRPKTAKRVSARLQKGRSVAKTVPTSRVVRSDKKLLSSEQLFVERGAIGRIARRDVEMGALMFEVETEDSARDTTIEDKITRCLENVELIRRRMANDQIEIDRLRLETRTLISEMLP